MAVIRQHRPDRLVAMKRSQLESLAGRMANVLERQIQGRRAVLETKSGMLRVLSPQATLERGFSITTNEKGRVIASIHDAAPGSHILTQLRDGVLKSNVESPEPQTSARVKNKKP